MHKSTIKNVEQQLIKRQLPLLGYIYVLRTLEIIPLLLFSSLLKKLKETNHDQLYIFSKSNKIRRINNHVQIF